MLKITIPSRELFDEASNMFIYTKEQTLQLEHSLVSLSKWESKWHKSFIHTEKKTVAETIDYIRCMTLTQNVDPNVYNYVTDSIIDQVNEYISAPMTATTFANESNGGNRQIITSELIYYWMISFNIPFECQKWHLNRLLTLLNVCSIKNAPAKKMNKQDIMSRNQALNAARRKKYGTKG